ncbi:MAG: twin-arginine translocation signal domain-containing protein [Acidobacteria bacterium]|nr:twin-arginine translocation signal domain-containing protein [Acidobacteriota bacterium]
MNEAILEKLEARLDRRTFLRGSALAAAALLGVAAASPVITFAQTQDKPQSQDDPKKEDESKKDEPKDEKPYRSEGADGKFYDRQGVEVRECPECGHNQYQQGRTWTCENCGYSYVE